MQGVEEQDRADLYALLAALLLGPDAALVEALGRTQVPEAPAAPLRSAWAALVQAAARRGAAALDEHAGLFVATGNPRVDPYQCKYVAGWLMDKPLARLRQDLRALGLARAQGCSELEDHLGALFEAMGLLIRQQRPLAQQQSFFAAHLAGWAGRCLDDIAAVPGTEFYGAVARFARAFLALEEQAFALDATTGTDSPPLRNAPHVEAQP